MLTRIISAIIMAILIAAVILFAPAIIFNGVVLLVIMGGLYEFFKLTMPSVDLYRETGWIYGVAIASSILFWRQPLALTAAVILGLFFVTLIHMHHATTLEGVTSRIAMTLLGAVYLGATLPFWGMLRAMPHGKALVFMGIGATAMSDTFALFTGKAIGKHKFAPLTSPNKTMEGFIGGFAGSILSVLIVKMIGWQELPIVHVIIIGFIIGVVGPFGDLVESMIKRDHHVKDSGNIIPGHGGFLDRLDAMIFVAPVLYLYAKWILSL